jgi:hypothetical protein
MNGTNAYGKAKILTTPMGNIAGELIANNVALGVSSRGAGAVNESGNVSGYQLITIDLVAQPSANAYPSAVYESLELATNGKKILDLAEAIRYDESAQKYFKNEIFKWLKTGVFKKMTESKYKGGKDMPGYGDPETWPSYLRTTSTSVKRRPSYDSDYEDDDYQLRQRKHKESSYTEELIDREGTINGEKFNGILVINASSQENADRRLNNFEDVHWGAKQVIEVKQSETEKGVQLRVYFLDRHKYGFETSTSFDI